MSIWCQRSCLQQPSPYCSTQQESLWIDNNNMRDFDLQLPLTMDLFFIKNNQPDLKIKHLGFLFRFRYEALIIDGDFVDVLSDDKDLAKKEYTRGRLSIMCELGHEYIYVRELHNDET